MVGVKIYAGIDNIGASDVAIEEAVAKEKNFPKT